jgi:hypothetical protein
MMTRLGFRRAIDALATDAKSEILAAWESRAASVMVTLGMATKGAPPPPTLGEALRAAASPEAPK